MKDIKLKQSQSGQQSYLQPLLRSIPSVEEVFNSELFSNISNNNPRLLVLEATRIVLETIREHIKNLDKTEAPNYKLPNISQIQEQIKRLIQEKTAPKFCRSINASGIILHTGLGRAVLAAPVVESLKKQLSGYTRLAIDLNTGQRKDRDKIIENLICEITGAEAATLVNNNSAATVLILNTLAKGKEIICSRGQLVEIGGSFRIPEIMEISMAKLKGVGTTNRTHLKDYQNAICDKTGAILRVHASNYRIIGFTSDVPIADIVKLGHKYKLPVIDDLGSGALVDLTAYGLTDEPLVSTSVKAGADVICFSADKLIGGPQAGIIIGKKKYIEPIRKNPLYRAFRVCKMTLVALEETLKLFRYEKVQVLKSNPTLRMLTTDIGELETRAQTILIELTKIPGLEASVINEYSQAGSGSLAGYNIPSKCVAIKSTSVSSQRLAERLRKRAIPILTRIKDNRVLFDIRTVFDGEEPELLSAVKDILGTSG